MAIPIYAEDYLMNEIMKGNKQQIDNKPNKLKDKFAKMHSSEQINKIVKERKDTEPKLIEVAENIDKEHN